MPSSRRRFLTGGSLLDAARDAGQAFADTLQLNAGRSPPQAGETIRLETRAMACPWAVILDPGPPQRTWTASAALDEVQRVERLLTVYRDDSPVSRLNRDGAHRSQAVAPQLFALLERCFALHCETGGAFDPAVQSLVSLWQSCRSAGRVPEPAEIESALRARGMDKVVLTPATEDALSPTVGFSTAGVGLNFGAIGKGYAIDRAAEILQHGGIADFVVHGGHSSLYAAGEHYGQGGWPIGLKNPLFTDESFITLNLSNQALGTSGSNIQYFRHAGRRYGHILDPRTGWPAESLLSVSVVASSAAEADALSTAFYVLGLEKAVEYCDTHPRVGAILTPPSAGGRKLSPVVCNLPAERLFLTSDDVEIRFHGRVDADVDPDDGSVAGTGGEHCGAPSGSE